MTPFEYDIVILLYVVVGVWVGNKVSYPLGCALADWRQRRKERARFRAYVRERWNSRRAALEAEGIDVDACIKYCLKTKSYMPFYMDEQRAWLDCLKYAMSRDSLLQPPPLDLLEKWREQRVHFNELVTGERE